MFTTEKDLATVAVNGINIKIVKNRLAKLSEKQLQLIKQYDKINKINGNNELTRELQIRTLIRFAIIFGKEFDELTEEDINDVLYGYKGGTLNAYKAHFKKFFKWLGKPELVTHLKIQVVPEKLTQDDLWTDEEIIKLLTACDDTTMEGKRNQAIIMIIYDLMLERMAVVNLNIEDIIEKDDIMKIKVTGKRRGKIERTILQAIHSVYYIKEWLKVHPHRTCGTQPLFISLGSKNFGKRLDTGTIWLILNRTAKKSSINKPIRPHLLRHSKATWLSKKGFRGKPLQKRMRHSNIMTQQRYDHFNDDDANNELFLIETGIDQRERKNEKKILLSIVCPKCNTSNPPSNVYCDSCSFTLNPKVDALEQMISRYLKSMLYQTEKQISRETNEFMDIEMLAEKYDQLLRDQRVKGRKQVTVH